MEYFQIHYFLEEGNHSMDAFIGNKAETHALRVFREVVKELGLENDIIFESVALEEGGIRAFYKILQKKKNRARVKSFATFLGGVLSVVISQVVVDQIKRDPEKEQLDKKEQKLRIRQLERELADTASSPEKKQDVIMHISLLISENNGVMVNKSAFYSTLLKDENVQKVSTQTLDSNKSPTGDETVVDRKDFGGFILNSTELDPEIRSDQAVEIIAPVLEGGNMKWKGRYEGQPINFRMKDEEFRNSVQNREVSFTSGMEIVCDLEFEREMDEYGEVKVFNISAHNVTEVIEGTQRISVSRKKKSVDAHNQISLFTGDSPD